MYMQAATWDASNVFNPYQLTDLYIYICIFAYIFHHCADEAHVKLISSLIYHRHRLMYMQEAVKMYIKDDQ